MKIFEAWKNVKNEGYKNFLIYQDEREFYNSIPEEVYGVYDYKGNFVGDFLESDFCKFYDEDIFINADNYEAQGLTKEDISNYPTNIGNYFVDKRKQNVIPQIKKNRTVIVILDEPKWKNKQYG